MAEFTDNGGATSVPSIPLGGVGFHVSIQGLGCAGMAGRYGPQKSEDELISLIRHAVSKGVTFLDTADIYGPFISEILVGKAIKGIREKVQLATKFGVWRDKDRKPHVQGDPAYVRAACEASLKRLDVYCIDLYYQHRVDTTVPIEVTVGEMKKLVEEGKVKYIGLSDASAETIRRAHAVHPVTAVQIEWSLWNRQVEEEIVPTCRELGIGIVAYSPLGRGFLAAGPKIVETLADNDIRKNMSRFQVENMEKNKAAFESLCRVATRKGCTPAQLALAWVHSRGNDVAAIPGTSNVKNLEKNIEALSLRLTDDDINEIERAMSSADAGDKPSEIGVFNAWKIGHTPPLSSWNAE